MKRHPTEYEFPAAIRPLANVSGPQPQVTKQQYDRIMEYVEKGKSEGAKLLAGGTKHGDSKGFFITPTVFSDVKEHHSINQEEVFGPFVVFDTFETQEEAIRKYVGSPNTPENVNFSKGKLHIVRPWCSCFY